MSYNILLLEFPVLDSRKNVYAHKMGLDYVSVICIYITYTGHRRAELFLIFMIILIFVLLRYDKIATDEMLSYCLYHNEI